MTKLYSLLLSFFIIVVIAFNDVVFTAAGLNVYLNFIGILFLIPVILIKGQNYSKNVLLYFMGTIFILAINSLLFGLSSVGTMYFVVFVLVCISILFFGKIRVSSILIMNSVLIGFVLSALRVVVFNGEVLSNLGVSNRVDANFIGSVNNFSYLLTTGVVLAYYNIKSNLLKFGAIVLLAGINLITLSRGGNLILFLFLFYILIFRIRWYAKIFIVGGGILALMVVVKEFSFITDNMELFSARYDLSSDTRGSGRVDIWSKALSEMSNIKSLLLGNGIGSFRYYHRYGVHVSVHNQYLDFLYNCGIPLTLFFILPYFIMVARLIKKFTFDNVLVIINCVYIISFIFDSRLWVVQTSWIFGLFVGISIKHLYEK